MYNDGFVPQGWQCPRCKRIYSPTYPWCIFCSSNDQSVIVSDKTTSSVPTHLRCTCYHDEYGHAECWGTKEKEPCICGGDKNKCDFYPYPLNGIEVE